MFFAKPRLSAAVINCADCPASLISGSLAFVTVYPPPHLSLSLSIHASIHPSIHPSVHLLPPSFSPFRSNHLSLSLSLAARERHPSPLLTPPRPFVCACFDRLSSPLPHPFFRFPTDEPCVLLVIGPRTSHSALNHAPGWYTGW